MKKFIYVIPAGILLLAALFFPACKNIDPVTPEVANSVSAVDNDVIVEWNDVFLEIERYASGYRPGPAPRALGLIGLANYEACISGMPDHNSIAYLYPSLSIPKPDPTVRYHWPSVVNASYAFLMEKFFPHVPADKTALVASKKLSLEAKYSAETDLSTFEASKKYGEAVASAVWDWSRTDPYGHDAYKDPFGDYKWEDHYAGDGNWKPTFPGPGKPMFPNWGKVRTFAVTESEKLCPAPHAYGTDKTSNFYAQAIETYAQSGPTITYEGKWIGQFWSDDLTNLTFSPGPRWIAIANQVYREENCNLETAIFANAKVGMALNDAAVSCWHSKYYYNVERPISYINRLIDPNYKTALTNPLTGEESITPSFPAYPSGHATMGAAGAEALSSVFGYDYAMTDHCHQSRAEFLGTPRVFGSFYEMAEENAWSRVPLGVHFRMDAEQGVNLGYRCARKVNELPWKK